MPTIHIPDVYAYEIVKLGFDPKDFVKDAVRDKLKEYGIDIEKDE